MSRSPALFAHAAACLSVAAVLSLGGCAGRIAGESYSGPTSLPAIRAANGLGPLAEDRELDRAAAAQAANMARAGRMEHTTAGGSFATRMGSVTTNGSAAENIAYGRFGSEELFRIWMNSPPHRRNILNPTFARYGLASAPDASGERRYWALVLAR